MLFVREIKNSRVYANLHEVRVKVRVFRKVQRVTTTIRDDHRRSWQPVLHESEHRIPYFKQLPEGQRRIKRACNLDYNLSMAVRGERARHNRLDDKPQT